MDWSTILEKDPAFAGRAMADISFDASYVLPTFTYSLTAATLQRLRAIPMLLQGGVLEQLGAGASHQLSRAARANALALIPTGTVELPAGTIIDVVPLT